MNTKIFITICCLYLVQSINAHIVRRDIASGPPATPNLFTEGPLAEFITLAKTQVESLQKKILEAAGVENQEQLIDSVANKTRAYANTVQGLLSVIQEETAKQAGQIDEVTKSLTTKLQANIKQLQEQNPQLVQAAEEYKQKLGTQLEGILAETQKLATSLEGQAGQLSVTLNNAFKSIAQETSGAATQIIQNVDMAIKEKHDIPAKPNK